jgi:hypothetical protein
VAVQPSRFWRKEPLEAATTKLETRPSIKKKKNASFAAQNPSTQRTTLRNFCVGQAQSKAAHFKIFLDRQVLICCSSC